MRPVPEVTDLDIAFPTKALKILPPYAKIPDEFKNDGNPWADLASTWFFKGTKGVNFVPKAGVDVRKALRAIAACLGDWGPKHEHKIAGVAFLLSEWFEPETLGTADRKRKKGVS